MHASFDGFNILFHCCLIFITWISFAAFGRLCLKFRKTNEQTHIAFPHAFQKKKNHCHFYRDKDSYPETLITCFIILCKYLFYLFGIVRMCRSTLFHFIELDSPWYLYFLPVITSKQWTKMIISSKRTGIFRCYTISKPNGISFH